MKLLALAFLLASTCLAESSVFVMNYSTARLQLLRSIGLPVPQKPCVQVFLGSNDESVRGFVVTLTSSKGAESLWSARKDGSGFVAFLVDTEAADITVELVSTASVMKAEAR